MRGMGILCCLSVQFIIDCNSERIIEIRPLLSKLSYK